WHVENHKRDEHLLGKLLNDRLAASILRPLLGIDALKFVEKLRRRDAPRHSKTSLLGKAAVRFKNNAAVKIQHVVADCFLFPFLLLLARVRTGNQQQSCGEDGAKNSWKEAAHSHFLQDFSVLPPPRSSSERICRQSCT